VLVLIWIVGECVGVYFLFIVYSLGSRSQLCSRVVGLTWTTSCIACLVGVVCVKFGIVAVSLPWVADVLRFFGGVRVRG